MGRLGRKRRLALESRCLKLIGKGVGTGDACSRLGISGTPDYCQGVHRGGLPRSSWLGTPDLRYLSLLQRERFGVVHAEGLRIRAIVARMKRAPSRSVASWARSCAMPTVVVRLGACARADRRTCPPSPPPVVARDAELRAVAQQGLHEQREPGADRRLAQDGVPESSGVADALPRLVFRRPMGFRVNSPRTHAPVRRCGGDDEAVSAARGS